MQKLYSILKNYTLKDALKLEKQDQQYKALEKLWLKLGNNKLFFWLIITNSLLAYQLSSTGEQYWKEFSECAIKYFWKFNKELHINFSDDIIIFIKEFLPNSRWNKRILNMKMRRLDKIDSFLEKFNSNTNKYLDNIILLRNDLAISMKQKKDAKTIVFAIKMIIYWKSISKMKTAKDMINQITIPIDSRLEKVFQKYKEEYTDIKKFYRDLSVKLCIPEINLDAILWLKYKELTK